VHESQPFIVGALVETDFVEEVATGSLAIPNSATAECITSYVSLLIDVVAVLAALAAKP